MVDELAFCEIAVAPICRFRSTAAARASAARNLELCPTFDWEADAGVDAGGGGGGGRREYCDSAFCAGELVR